MQRKILVGLIDLCENKSLYFVFLFFRVQKCAKIGISKLNKFLIAQNSEAISFFIFLNFNLFNFAIHVYSQRLLF